MARAQELMYAVVGVGDFAVDKAKNVRKYTDPKTSEKYYKDFVKRGRKISTKVKNSKTGKQVSAQTETARAKVEDAAKSVGKAFGVNVVSWPKSRKSSRPSSTKKSSSRTTKKTTSKAS